MEEEVLWKLQVLNEKRPELCQCLSPKDHYPYLRSKYILSREDEETIESQTTTKEKVHALVDILMKKLPQGFDELVKALIFDKTQVHLAKMLNQEFENKRRNCYGQQNIVNTSQVPQIIPYTSHSTISDLGVDTDKLPKPHLPKKLAKDVNKDTDIILELYSTSDDLKSDL